MNKTIDNSIVKLSNYFNNMEINPPAEKELIQDLKNLYPYLNDGVIEFYSQCNGFNLNLQDNYKHGIIISLEQLFEMMKESMTGENPLFTVLLPLRNDGFWNFDCILMNNSIGDGSIVFWDNGTSPKPDFLLASSLEKYFKFLTEDFITRYQKDGNIKFEYDVDNPNMLEFPWPFNVDWIRKYDLNYAQLQMNKEFIKLFYDRNLE